MSISRDLRTIEDILARDVPLDQTFGIQFRDVTIRLIVANEAWNPPDGEFDPDVLVQPGLLSNVENGFGFVGAGYRLTGFWAPEDTIMVRPPGGVVVR